MSYLREVRVEELIDWLDRNDYHQIDSTDLAQRLVDRFDILTTSHTAT